MATKCAINGRQWGAYDGRRQPTIVNTDDDRRIRQLVREVLNIALPVGAMKPSLFVTNSYGWWYLGLGGAVQGCHDGGSSLRQSDTAEFYTRCANTI
jgi:hypothetical protein